MGHEIKRSLQTRHPQKARQKAQYLGALVGQLFNHTAWQRLLVALDNTQRKRVINAWLSKRLAEYESGLIESGPMDEGAKDEMVYAQEMLVSDARERLYLQQYDHARKAASETLRSLKLPTDGADDPYLLRGLLTASVEAEKHHLALLLSGTIEGDSLQPTQHGRADGQGMTHDDQSEPSHTTRGNKELVAEFLKETANDVTPKSLREYETSFKVLIELLGSQLLGDLRRKDAIELRDELLDYPLNRMKGKNAALTLEQIKSADTWQTISSTTANKHFTRWSTLASWACQWDYLHKNYLESLAPEPEESRKRTWTKEELQSIFTRTSSERVKANTAWQYWLPLLGLVTGARIDELCGLQTSDIMQTESGVWFFNFENNEFRRLKNKQSRRQTPMHTGLLTLGFLEYVQSQKPGLIFPSLQAYSSESLGHEPSKWFGRLKSDLGYGKDVNFHTFRHLMRNMLSDVEAEDSHIKSIVGHEQGDVTFGTYGDRLKPDLTKKHIEALPVTQYLQMQPHYRQLQG